MNMTPPHRSTRNWDRLKALEMYQQGCTDLQIADAVGVSKSTISNWRSQHGLPPNTGTTKDKNHRKSKLSLDAAEAKAAGMNYGQWKALQGQ